MANNNVKNKETGFRNWSDEPEVTPQPSVTSGDALLFKSFVDASSESENATEEFSGVSKNFCANPSFVENFPSATEFSADYGKKISENLGQGILILKTEELLERAGGHVAQWKELLSHSGEDAGSKSARESRRAHTNLHAHSTIEKKENQARSLKKAPLSLRGISREFYSSSEIAEPHTLEQVEEDEVFKTFAETAAAAAELPFKNYKNQTYSLDKATLQLKGMNGVISYSLFKLLHFGVKND